MESSINNNLGRIILILLLFLISCKVQNGKYLNANKNIGYQLEIDSLNNFKLYKTFRNLNDTNVKKNESIYNFSAGTVIWNNNNLTLIPIHIYHPVRILEVRSTSNNIGGIRIHATDQVGPFSVLLCGQEHKISTKNTFLDIGICSEMIISSPGCAPYRLEISDSVDIVLSSINYPKRYAMLPKPVYGVIVNAGVLLIIDNIPILLKGECVPNKYCFLST
jgi:hypothetical protein